MIEVKMPLVRITEWKDGAVFKTEPAGEAWIPGFIAIPGRQYGDDPNVRLGTPDRFESRRVSDGHNCCEHCEHAHLPENELPNNHRVKCSAGCNDENEGDNK